MTCVQSSDRGSAGAAAAGAVRARSSPDSAGCTDMADDNAMADGDTAPDMKVSDGETGADAGADGAATGERDRSRNSGPPRRDRTPILDGAHGDAHGLCAS